MTRKSALLAAVAVALAPTAAWAADVAPSYVPRAYAPGPVAAPKYAPPPPCYVTFHRDRNGVGPALTRYGPEAVPRIGQLRYANGRSLNNRVLSITTGPGTAIDLYKGRRFRRLESSFGPGQVVNLNRPKIDSYRISCRVPPPAY